MNVLFQEKQDLVLAHLVEGVSIRTIERLTGENRNTIMSLFIKTGEIAREIHDAYFVNIQSRFIQIYEIMSSTRKCNALKELVKLEYGTTQMLQSDNA